MRILQQDNIGSHYRSAIYCLMDKELGCDFCFGDKVADIKKLDYSLLNNDVFEVKNIYLFKHLYWQKGILKFLHKKYDTYIFIGEVRCISTWIFALLTLFYPHKRIYFWSHGVLDHSSGLKALTHRLFYSLCVGAFIYNERSTKLLVEEGIPSIKLHTIYNSLDYDKQLSLRNHIKPSRIFADHFGNENKTIVFIGRLTQSKRFDILIKALSKLKKQGEHYNVTFIGDGIERENMERMVKELELEDYVWFYGACYDEERNAELIYNADICVSPGSIGLTAIHSLMFGCPVITNDDFDHQGPEFEAIQDGVSGSFFKSGDDKSLANAISSWFKSHRNDREKIRNACYEIIDSKWNPHNQIRIIKKVIGI